MQNPFRKEPSDFGLVFDLEQDSDPRNLYWEELAPLGAVDEVLHAKGGMPSEVLRNLNQGHTSACTCHAVVHAFSLLENIGLSARYAFWKIKTDQKYRSSELPYGAYMIDPIRLLINEGISTYDGAYDERDTKTDAAYIAKPVATDKLIKGGAYLYVTSAGTSDEKWRQLQRYLAYECSPVLIGVTWRTSFNNARKTGVVPAQEPTGKSVGHAMLATNYEYRTGELYFRCENSFGDTWGDKGAVWLPARYVKLQSAIAYLPPDEVENIGIVKPESVEARNANLEKANADAIWKAVYDAFPRVGDVKADAANNAARSLYAKMKLLMVQAVTYRKYTPTDCVNFIYARTRSKTKTKAYNIDFTKERNV